MKVTVQLFGPLAEQAGAGRVDVDVAAATVAGAVEALRKARPGLRLEGRIRYAVNTDYAEPAAALREGDVVSLIPPVGGG